MGYKIRMLYNIRHFIAAPYLIKAALGRYTWIVTGDNTMFIQEHVKYTLHSLQ